MNLAFVLLAEARIPKGEEIVQNFSSFALPGQTISLSAAEDENASSLESVSLQIRENETAVIALMPMAVPNNEADDKAQFSISAFSKGWTLPEHNAHLAVTVAGPEESPSIESLTLFTALLAAVAQASDAVGIYWGAAGATHDSKFFIEAAAEKEMALQIMLWNGLGVARDEEGNLQLLSLGMQQLLDLPDLLLIAPGDQAGRALETFFDLLAFVAQRGEALPEGDTVGLSQDQQMPVEYIPSPLDPEKKVWRINLI